jgi:large subunit ribosomal protein L1
MIMSDDLLKLALETAINQSVIKKDGKKDKVRKFDETLDIVINLRDFDIRNPNNKFDQELILPNAIKQGKLNICFIANGDMVVRVKEKKYDVADDPFLAELDRKDKKTKKMFAKKYDIFVCQAPLMRNVAKVLGRFLGQMNKMPKPQPNGYGIIKVDENIDKIIEIYSKVIRVQTKKSPVIQTIFGKKSLPIEKNLENLKVLLNLIEARLPNGAGNFKSIYIKTTMGISTKVTEPEARIKGGKR